MSQIKLSKKMVMGTLIAVSSMVILSQPVQAEGEMEIIDRIRPVGKVKISADKAVALVESLTKKAAEPVVPVPVVEEAKEAVIEAVDQVAETTKEVVEQAAEVADSALATVSETTEAVVETANEAAEEVEEVIAVASGDAAASTNNELGQQVFNKTCFACHGTGIPGFPKVGDKAVWAPRIAQGKALLIEHVTNGFNAMPARGGNPALTDEEVAAAVDYLVAESE